MQPRRLSSFTRPVPQNHCLEWVMSTPVNQRMPQALAHRITESENVSAAGITTSWILETVSSSGATAPIIVCRASSLGNTTTLISRRAKLWHRLVCGSWACFIQAVTSWAASSSGITWRVIYKRATNSGTTSSVTSSLSQALAEPSTVVSRTAPGSGNALDYDF